MYQPASHSEQLFFPGCAWKVPARQLLHLVVASWPAGTDAQGEQRWRPAKQRTHPADRGARRRAVGRLVVAGRAERTRGVSEVAAVRAGVHAGHTVRPVAAVA